MTSAVSGDMDLVDAVEQVLRRECTAAAVRAAVADPDGWRRLWSTATDLAWPALGVPEECGGLGVTGSAEAQVIERSGGAVFPAPLLSTATAVAVLRGLDSAAADDSPTADALSRIAEGAPATLAANGDLRWDGATLTGTAREVTDASRAELIVVVARPTEGGPPVAALVRAGDVVVRERANIDPTRPLADVAFDRTPAVGLGAGVEPGLNTAVTLVAAELLGVAGRALDHAVAYAKSRTQFGRPIGAFQGIKHRLADTYVAVERARSLVYAAAQADHRDAVLAMPAVPVAMAKAAAEDAASAAVRGAVQVSGALGITDELGLIGLLRRARQSAVLFGDARTHYRSVAAALVGGDTAAREAR